MSALVKLSESLPQVLESSEKATFVEEVREYTVDQEIDNLENLGVYSKCDNMIIDLNWWSHIFRLEQDGELKYKVLPKLVKAVITPFSGPLVEGSFNIMDDIITADRSTLTVENYEAIYTIKYNLRRQKLKAIDLKPNVNMRKAIHTAYTSYKEHISKKKLKTSGNLPMPQMLKKLK
ncbi:hypothetical protein JTE90_007395 [Oedothorax gibbosus]|uniref:Uncharacterized protein n=1 Tax=Oedothorax gibbosus TaxID=931172 RepID=A0AAV6TUL1_9ARAC|nr:hypothetical protein JTE90_007395 [Oedothorax gibbosus]